MGKRSKRCKLGCRILYCYDDRVFCIHELFRRGFVECLEKSGYGRQTRFTIYYDYRPKYKYQYGARAVLSRAEQVIAAIELAKKYDVDMTKV